MLLLNTHDRIRLDNNNIPNQLSDANGCMQWECIERNVAYRKLHKIRKKRYIEYNIREV
jgi:hypothetical protein